MATLFNTKISATYPGLLKTIDNAALSATLRELTDGAGNLSGLFLNTAGDFKVTNILEWGSLKDTGTGVTITRFVTSTDGLENFDNNTTLPTSAAVKLYVDTKFATSDTLQEVLSFGNTTSGNDIAVSASDDITFTDSSKILMGAGSDLQIYHNGTDSYITDSGTGDLYIQGSDDIYITSESGEKFITCNTNDSVEIRFNNSIKLATTNTGLSVTGVISNVTDPVAAQDAATKNYVDNLDAGSDLDITDGTTAGAVNLNTQSLSILGTTNEIETVVSGQGVTIGLPSSISTNLVGDVTGNLTGDVTGNLTGTATQINITTSTVDQNNRVLLSLGFNGSQSVINDSGLLFNPVSHLLTVDGSGTFSGDLTVTGNITGGGGSFLPLAGGTMTGDIVLNDGVKTVYGTANDGLWIYHDGSNSYINDVGTGDLYIRSNSLAIQSPSGNETIASFAGTGGQAATLYAGGSAKLATTSTGISVTGNVDATGNVSVLSGQKVNLGNSEELFLTHDSYSILRSSAGSLYIDQAAVTESIFFRVSDANALDVTALTISRNGDLTTGRDVTIAGDLTVNGTTTTVNSQTLSVDDPLISLAINNAANSLDIGYYGKYNDGTTRYLGLFNDASDSNKFKLFKGTTVEPTTTVDIGGAGYVAADLELANLVATGNITVGDAHTIGNDGNDNLLIESSTGENVIIRSANIINLRTNGNNNALILDASQNATFAGNATINGTAYVDTVRDTNSEIIIRRASNILRIGSGDASDETQLYSGGQIALTLDTSQKGIFSGSLGVGVTPTEKLEVAGAIVWTGALSASKTNSGVLDRSGNNLRVRAYGATAGAGALQFRTGGGGDAEDTLALTIDSSQNSTFAGDVTVQGATLNLPNSSYQITGGSAIGDLRFVAPRYRFYEDTISGTPVLQLDGGNVTVGSKMIAPKLSIQNQINTSSAGLEINYENGDGTTTNFKNFYVRDGKNAILLNIQGETKKTSIFGQVGIGAAAGSAMLDVRGDSDSSDIFVQLDNNKYGSTDTAGETKIGFGWLNHSGASIAAYKDGTVNRTGFKFYSEVGFNSESLVMQLASAGDLTINKAGAGHALVLNSDSAGGDFIKCVGETGDTVFTFDSDGTGGEAALRMYKDGVLKNYFAANGDSYFNNVGNVGIGTANPSAKLHILEDDDTVYDPSADDGQRGVGATIQLNNNSTVTNTFGQIMHDTDSTGQAIARIVFLDAGAASSAIAFVTENGEQKGERLRIAPNGNVGIGTDSPRGILDLKYSGNGTLSNTTSEYQLVLEAPSGTSNYGRNIGWSESTGVNVITSAINAVDDGASSATGLTFSTGNSSTLTEKMRITSGGDVLIGTEGIPNGTTFFGSAFVKSTLGRRVLYLSLNTTNSNIIASFYNPNGRVGTIATSGSSTSFNTTSDYRLKEDLQDFAGLDMVSKIPVYDFKWKSDESRSYGVMAHELQEVLPDAVSGEKDAEEMQGVDYSKIVPLLVKSIQELTAKVEMLEKNCQCKN